MRRYTENVHFRGRRWLPRVGAVAVLITATAGLSGSQAAPPAPRAIAPAPLLVGAQAHLLWNHVDGQELNRQLNALVTSGARIVRVDVSWASLQPESRDRWAPRELERLDRLVRRARERRLKLLLTLWETPCWASRASAALKQGCQGAWWQRGVQRYPPVNPQEYARALATLVERYGRRVRAWEIWNEPNSHEYFRSADAATDYAALVKAAHPAVKAADPRPLLVAGSLMHADYRFTRTLYERGIAGKFDAFSIHPYSDGRSPLDEGSDRWLHASFARGVPATREVMRRNGDDKPLWLTEFGWNTSNVRDDDPWRNGVDEETQARYVDEALAKVAEWEYVDVAIYYELIDMSPDPGEPNGNFGLLRHDFGEKPAFGAFRARALAARASGAGTG